MGLQGFRAHGRSQATRFVALLLVPDSCRMLEIAHWTQDGCSCAGWLDVLAERPCGGDGRGVAVAAARRHRLGSSITSSCSKTYSDFSIFSTNLNPDVDPA